MMGWLPQLGSFYSFTTKIYYMAALKKIKNVATVAVGAIGWCTTGWALAFGKDNHDAVEGGGFFGTDQFFVQADSLDKDAGSTWSFFLFQFMFCATGATIVSGAMAERCRLEGYVLFSLAMW